MTTTRQFPVVHRMTAICDFDGTISLGDVTDGLLDRFAAPDWVRLEEQWLAGAIGSRECMSGQVAMMEASPSELDDYLDGVRIDPHFPDFARACERLGVGLRVVSDGIDRAVRRVLGNHDLGHLEVAANTLVALPGNRYRLEFPYAATDCSARAGTCKCAFALRHPGATVLIGDGSSDICVASNVDFVFAKDRLLAHCRTQGITHLPFQTFLDVERALAGILENLAPSRAILHSTPEIPSDA